jgi:hypothetical protein
VGEWLGSRSGSYAPGEIVPGKDRTGDWVGPRPCVEVAAVVIVVGSGYGLDDRGSIRGTGNCGIFLFDTAVSRPAVRPTQPPIQ